MVAQRSFIMELFNRNIKNGHDNNGESLTDYADGNSVGIK